MGKWGKYPKRYSESWEKEEVFKHWLERTSEQELLQGKPEAHCKLCFTHIRAHRNDLLVHSKTEKHEVRERSLDRNSQRSLHNYGCLEISDEAKSIDLKLTAFIALHCPVKPIDHLCAILKVLGKESRLEHLRIHRTKCSKLISAVISPAFITELIRDIGDSPYAIIADESTDVSVTKFMGLCIRYYSKTQKRMVTDFLGIVQVTSCTGENLASALKAYLDTVGLPLNQLHSIGTDGAPNMCGEHNSFYSHLKKDVPNLQLVKCICHSIDKCAQYAVKDMPNELSALLHGCPNWFAHSAKRWSDYVDFYKERNGGKIPCKLKKLCTPRWLVWLPLSSVVLDQWNDLREFFLIKSTAPDDFKAKELVKLFTNSNFQLLTFLRSILRDVHSTKPCI